MVNTFSIHRLAALYTFLLILSSYMQKVYNNTIRLKNTHNELSIEFAEVFSNDEVVFHNIQPCEKMNVRPDTLYRST